MHIISAKVDGPLACKVILRRTCLNYLPIFVALSISIAAEAFRLNFCTGSLKTNTYRTLKLFWVGKIHFYLGLVDIRSLSHCILHFKKNHKSHDIRISLNWVISITYSTYVGFTTGDILGLLFG